jgi:hypothetical protein
MKIHQNIRPVKGYCKTLLVDLEKFKFYSLKNEEIEILDIGQFPQIELKNLDSKPDIFLNDLNPPQLEIDFGDWDVPHIIADLFIEYPIETLSLDQLKGLMIYFNLLGISSVTYYSSRNDLTKDDLKRLLNLLKKSTLSQLSLYLKYNDNLFSDDFLEMLIYNPYVQVVVISESPFNKNFEDKVHYIKDKVSKYTGASENSFSCNIMMFRESQRHHTYFNRKLYIGLNGEIKNAPECEEEFGCVEDISSPGKLKEIIASPEFQKYWHVHKELCDVCKDCEFRHMCVDNRLPYQRKNGSWYHKKECSYNPYICKWKGEEGYKTLEECGVISNEQGLSIDHDKIAPLNEKLWTD